MSCFFEDLLTDAYYFFLTSRFQSNPLQRRYGQCQMNGGRFLVSLKDVEFSEKILKIKYIIINEGLDIDGHLKIRNDFMLDIELVQRSVQHTISDVRHISLNNKTREKCQIMLLFLLQISPRSFVKGFVKNGLLMKIQLVEVIINSYCVMA